MSLLFTTRTAGDECDLHLPQASCSQGSKRDNDDPEISSCCCTPCTFSSKAPITLSNNTVSVHTSNLSSHSTISKSYRRRSFRPLHLLENYPCNLLSFSFICYHSRKRKSRKKERKTLHLFSTTTKLAFRLERKAFSRSRA